LKFLRNLLIGAIAISAFAFAALNWILPVAMAFYAQKRAPQITQVVPQPLKDSSIGTAPGRKLSYLEYEFEVPWTDLDDSATQLLPKSASAPNRVDLHFRSGLRLIVTAVPPREWATNLARETKSSPEQIEAFFGRDTVNSDYHILKAIYEFTPQKMNLWSTTQHGVNRDELLLILKSIVPLKAAQSGIFYLQNAQLLGFQEGTPSPHQDVIAVHMFGDRGSVEMMFFQAGYKNSQRVTQSEINRMVQTLRESSADRPKQKLSVADQLAARQASQSEAR
jgi:hypothetical protein